MENGIRDLGPQNPPKTPDFALFFPVRDPEPSVTRSNRANCLLPEGLGRAPRPHMTPVAASRDIPTTTERGDPSRTLPLCLEDEHG